jgi:hypothetical protein
MLRPAGIRVADSFVFWRREGQIPQESWFLLGRAHTLDQGHPVLLSWTGTMFDT